MSNLVSWAESAKLDISDIIHGDPLRTFAPLRFTPRIALLAQAKRAVDQTPEPARMLHLKGVCLINDMTDLSLSNLDTRIPKLIGNMLSGAMPVRLGAIYIVNPPFFFNWVVLPIFNFCETQFFFLGGFMLPEIWTCVQTPGRFDSKKEQVNKCGK